MITFLIPFNYFWVKLFLVAFKQLETILNVTDGIWRDWIELYINIYSQTLPQRVHLGQVNKDNYRKFISSVFLNYALLRQPENLYNRAYTENRPSQELKSQPSFIKWYTSLMGYFILDLLFYKCSIFHEKTKCRYRNIELGIRK